MCVYSLYVYGCFLVFFFFKQKTAYEMRISDWSSDVCSSDLRVDNGSVMPGRQDCRFRPPQHRVETSHHAGSVRNVDCREDEGCCPLYRCRNYQRTGRHNPRSAIAHKDANGESRSEEHKSELQSLMRTPYAVFRLKKNINYNSTP